jgi:hypothetical protein
MARTGDRKGAHRILVGKSEGSRPLRRPTDGRVMAQAGLV